MGWAWLRGRSSSGPAGMAWDGYREKDWAAVSAPRAAASPNILEILWRFSRTSKFSESARSFGIPSRFAAPLRLGATGRIAGQRALMIPCQGYFHIYITPDTG